LKGLLNQGSEVVVVKKVEETRARVVNVFDIFATRVEKTDGSVRSVKKNNGQ